MSRVSVSHLGDLGIQTSLVQMLIDLFNANDFKTDTSSFLARRSALLGYGMDWLAQCQDNVTAWDIRSWHWQPGFQVGQCYKVVISVPCHKFVPVLI